MRLLRFASLKAPLLVLCLFASACEPDMCFIICERIVTTDYGRLKGWSDGSVSTYMHIPYAQPPTGSNRWREPQPLKPWGGLWNAAVNYTGCVQWSKPTSIFRPMQSDDCLYLNIWVPETKGPHPVMVYIHGGALQQGSGSEPSYIGDNLASRQDVIVVTFNYRLGVAGFLSLPELSAESTYGGSGNYGFLDQVAALKWVNSQISNFGGDPDNITLFGESAGGLSVCMHMASPLSQQLFDKAIIQSGPCTSWITHTIEDAHKAGIALANRFGCHEPNRLQCLRSLPEQSIKDRLTTPFNEIFIRDFDEWGFFPHVTIDGYFLEEPFEQSIRNASNKPPVIIGNVSKEGSLWEVYTDHPATGGYENYLHTRFPERATDLYQIYPIEEFSNVGEAMAAIIGDWLMYCPTVKLSDLLHDEGYPVFQYIFTEYSDSILRALADSQKGINAPSVGIVHGSDVPFIFDRSGPTGEIKTTAQQNAALIISNYWSNFARSGNPNSHNKPYWPIYDTANKEHINLGEDFTTSKELRKIQCAYW